MQLDRFFIGGAWVKPVGSDTMPIVNPATEQAFGTLTLGAAADVDRAVAAAARGFEDYRQWSKDDRIALLHRIHEETETRAEDLARAQSQEMGCPISAARDYQTDGAMGQIPPFIAALEAQSERVTLENGDIEVREPIGICGMITPWNWPIYQAALKILPAIATGCCAILKPSEHTPLSATIYAEILHDAGVPAGVFNLVQGTGPEVGAAMSRHPGIQMMSFTGSTRGGVAVTRDAAPSVKRVALELGGKSPNLVFASADLETRIPGSIDDLVLTTGQICDAPSRMLVEHKVYDRVVELAAQAADAVQIGPPDQEGDHIGPLFDKMQFDRVQHYIQQGIDEGARLVAGGPGRPDGFNRGWYVRPTIFADVTPQMTIYREEIFGPVLVISPFEDEAEGIAMANDTPYGLAAYIQTGDRAQAERVAARLQAGAIHINGAAVNYGSPYGGYKASGNGREGGAHGLAEYQEIKTLHFAGFE